MGILYNSQGQPIIENQHQEESPLKRKDQKEIHYNKFLGGIKRGRRQLWGQLVVLVATLIMWFPLVVRRSTWHREKRVMSSYVKHDSSQCQNHPEPLENKEEHV